jgi:hypothetical protein
LKAAGQSNFADLPVRVSQQRRGTLNPKPQDMLLDSLPNHFSKSTLEMKGRQSRRPGEIPNGRRIIVAAFDDLHRSKDGGAQSIPRAPLLPQ